MFIRKIKWSVEARAISMLCFAVTMYETYPMLSIGTATRKAVPVDFEIKRAEDLLSNLDKTDDRLISNLANHIQMVKAMERDVDTMQATQ